MSEIFASAFRTTEPLLRRGEAAGEATLARRSAGVVIVLFVVLAIAASGYIASTGTLPFT